MSTRTNIHRLGAWLLVATALIAMWSGGSLVAAQQAAPKSSSGRPTAAPPARSAAPRPAAVDDAARKSEILASQPWRRAMFEMNEWLAAQRIYTPQQVEKIKADFAAKVHRMSAQELQFMLEDMDAKFKILETPQAQDARAWLAQYLSILADKKREEVIARLPNIATMTAPQLEQQIALIQQRRAAAAEQQKTVDQLRSSASNPWTQTTKLAEQAYIRDHTMQRSAYSSPYRAPASTQRPFADVHTGTSMGYYVNPYGGVGLIFGNGF